MIACYAFFRGEPTGWHKITAIPDLPVARKNEW